MLAMASVAVPPVQDRLRRRGGCAVSMSPHAWGRLVKVELPGGSPVLVAEYRYDPASPLGRDQAGAGPAWSPNSGSRRPSLPPLRGLRRAGALGRRIAKIVPNADSPGTWDRTDYYYNTDWQVLEERSASQQPIYPDLPAGSVTARYLWDMAYTDAPIFRDRDADGSGDGTLDERLYFTTDANHNVTAAVDELGRVVERYLYGPYGEVRVLNGAPAADADGNQGANLAEWTLDPDNKSDVAVEILYAGYRLDGETGLYHVRRRVYHPTLGRWLTRDPQGYADGMNLYLSGGGQDRPARGGSEPATLRTSRPVGSSIPKELGWKESPDGQRASTGRRTSNYHAPSTWLVVSADRQGTGRTP